MTKQQILEMTGLSEKEFYNKYPDQQSFMMEYGGMVEQYGSGGYTVRKSNDRKGKTHVVIGPGGKKKYFGDPKMGERGKSKHGKEAFYARHAKNLKNNPYFRAYAKATWEDGGIVYGEGGKIPQEVLRSRLEAHMSSDEAQDYLDAYKKGGWIQKATASIKRRGTEGVCTGSKFGGPTCPPGSKRYNLAKTFRKMAKARKKEEGGYVDMYADGGKLPEGILRARLESHMSPDEAQDYINNYAQGGVVDVYQLMGMPTPSMYGMGGTTNIGDLSHVISRKNFPNMGYAMGGPVMYKKGGFLTGLKDYGLAMVDTATSIVNPDIIGADSYSDTGFGKTMKGVSDITGGITNAAAPIVAGAFLGPVGSAAVSTAQNMSNQFVPQQQDNSTTRQIGNMFGSLAPLGGAIYSASANSTPKAAMGGQVNYPQGLRKNMGNMPIFAMGGMTGAPTEINVEKGELLVDPKTGKILTEYKGGGMVPHPEFGMDERGTVPAQEGKFVIPVKYKMGGMTYAERYKKAWKENDKDLMNALKNNTAYRKAKLEAKEEAEASKMMAKYGGAIQRMMARGGMINKYDLGGGTGGLNMNNPALGSYNLPSAFNQDMTYSMFPNVPQSLNFDYTAPTMTTNTSMFGSLDPTTFNFDNIPDTGIGYKGKGYKKPSSPNNPQNNWGQYLPMATSLAMGLEAALQKPFNMNPENYKIKGKLSSYDTPYQTDYRPYALTKYNLRQVGNAGPAGYTALYNAFAAQEAKNKLANRETNLARKMQADQVNLGIEGQNINTAMQLAMLNEQNRAARRNAMREQFGKNLPASFYNQQANQITMQALKAAYPDYNFDFGIFG